MTDTPNHNYNLPSEGTTNWHIPLNENFEQIDADVEIRAPEADKGEYEPKEGIKYEATDSGAVYYGNGSAWVLADRKVGEFQSDSSVTGEHLKAGNSSTAVVAPSVGSAFDGIQEAIDAGFVDIILAEPVTENGITLPFEFDFFRLRGAGDGMYQTIYDPETGDPVIQVDQDGDSSEFHVVLENIEIKDTQGGENCGIAIKGARDLDVLDAQEANWIGARSWVIRDVRVHAGPVYLIGPRNIVMNLSVQNWSENAFAIPNVETEDGDVYKDKMAGYFGGTTFAQHGGGLMARKDARTAAIYSVGGATIDGGITWANTDDKTLPDDEVTSNASFFGSSRVFISGISTEGGVDHDVLLGSPEFVNSGGGGLSEATVTGVSAFNTMKVTDTSRNIDIINPVIEPDGIEIEKKNQADMEIKTQMPVVITNDDAQHPYEITHMRPDTQAGSAGGNEAVYRIGGNKSSPATQMGPKIHTEKPQYPEPSGFLICDGDEWDAVGNGNAALLTYDTDGEWKPVFEYSSSI